MNKTLRSLDILKGIGIVMIIIVHNRHFIMKDMTGFRQIINYGQMDANYFSLCLEWHSAIHGITLYRKNIKKAFLFYTESLYCAVICALRPDF